MKSEKGFTLIEIMIAIVLLTIVVTTLWQISVAFQQFTREEGYRYACTFAHRTLLNITSTREFPPELHTVPGNSKVFINNIPLPESIEVYLKGKKIPSSQYSYNTGTREIVFSKSLIGEKVVINYKMALPAWEEIRTIPQEKPHKISLENGPVEKVISVKLAYKDTLVALPPSQYRVNLKKNSLEFIPSLAGRVILVSYQGKGLNGFLSGAFISADLKRESFAPTEWKILKLNIGYPGEKRWLKFFTLRRR